MGMGVERGAEAVDEGYGAHPGIGGGRFAVRKQGPFHRPEKQPQYRSRQGRIARCRCQRSRLGSDRTHWRTGSAGIT